MINRKRIFFSISIIIFIIPYFASSSSNNSAIAETRPAIPIYTILDDPISITNDTGLEAYPGSGTFGDPYRIENLVISTIDSDGIFIVSTTKYFLIQNCSIFAPNDIGIYLDGVETGTANIWNCTILADTAGMLIYASNYTNVYNNTIYNCITGLEMSNCYSPDIYNNTILNCNVGIYTNYCLYSVIRYNYVHDNIAEGIIVDNSPETVIQYNTCDDNRIGIQLDSSDDSHVVDNWCSDNYQYGIFIQFSDYTSVGSNNFNGCGLGVYDNSVAALLTLYVESNYISGSLIYYGENITDTNIWARYSQFILVNCSNVKIGAQDQLASNLYVSIDIHFSDRIVVRFSYINNGHFGINFYKSNNIEIFNNTFENNIVAITGYDSTGGSIKENYISTCEDGINFRYEVNNFSIYENNFHSMYGYSIVLDTSNYNEVYYNNFISVGAGSFGYDSGTLNYWYNTSLNMGNYWSNWVSGTYAIDGSAGTVDMFPLSSPWTPPVVSEYILLGWFAVVFLAIIPGLVIYLKKRK